MNNDVKNWMKTEFPQNLALLKSQAGDPLEIERLQNSLLKGALDNVYAVLAEQTLQIKMLSQKLDRRTAVLSPTKSFSVDTYQRAFEISSRKSFSFLRHIYLFNSLFQSPRAHSLSLHLPPTTCPQRLLEVTFQKIPVFMFLKTMDSLAHLSMSRQKSLQLHVQRLR
jgi:hypothetical protein